MGGRHGKPIVYDDDMVTPVLSCDEGTEEAGGTSTSTPRGAAEAPLEFFSESSKERGSSKEVVDPATGSDCPELPAEDNDDSVEVELTRNTGEAWGFAWHVGLHAARRLLVMGIDPASAVGKWDAAQRGRGQRGINRGDELVDVNGANEKGAMRRELAATNRVRLLFRRPSDVNLDTFGGGVGATFGALVAPHPPGATPSQDRPPQPIAPPAAPICIKNTFIHVDDEKGDGEEEEPDAHLHRSDPFPISQMRGRFSSPYTPGCLAGVDSIARAAGIQSGDGTLNASSSSHSAFSSFSRSGQSTNSEIDFPANPYTVGQAAQQMHASPLPSQLAPMQPTEFATPQYPQTTSPYEPAPKAAMVGGEMCFQPWVFPVEAFMTQAPPVLLDGQVEFSAYASSEALAGGGGGAPAAASRLAPAHGQHSAGWHLSTPLEEHENAESSSGTESDAVAEVPGSAACPARRKPTRRAGKRARRRRIHAKEKAMRDVSLLVSDAEDASSTTPAGQHASCSTHIAARAQTSGASEELDLAMAGKPATVRRGGRPPKKSALAGTATDVKTNGAVVSADAVALGLALKPTARDDSLVASAEGRFSGAPLAEDIIGQSVLLTGLTRTPEFNGEWGRVETYDVGLQRYLVQVLRSDGTPVMAKLRRENFILPPDHLT